MIKRLTSYIFTRSLSVIPLLLFLVLGTEFGLSMAAQISSTLFDITITNIHGSVISGDISIQHINSRNIAAEDVKIKIIPQSTLPFVSIEQLQLKTLTIKSNILLEKNKDSRTTPPISNLQIDSLNIESPLGKISGLNHITGRLSPMENLIKANWKKVPFTIQTKKSASNSQHIDILFNNQILKFVSKKTPDTLYIQAPPEQPGHFVLFYDKAHNAFTADIDHELNLSDDLAINAKIAAQWDHDKGTIHVNKFEINDQNKTLLLTGDYEYTLDKQLISTHLKLQDNQLNITGICLNNCDINLQYQFENMEQISSDLAGDAVGSAHIFGTWQHPSYYFHHESKHFRSKFLSANQLSISSNNNMKENSTHIKGSHLGIQNNLIDMPWSVKLQSNTNHLTGELLLDGQSLPFSGEISNNGSVKLLTQNIQQPWHFDKDILLSMDQSNLALNLHPVCAQYFDSHLCVSAHLSPTKSYIDIRDIHATGKATLPLHDPTSYFYIDHYKLTGSLFLSSSDALKIKSNIELTGSHGFIANIIPNFFIPISYEFESIKVLSTENGNQLTALIKSNQGDLNAYLKMNNALSGIEFKLDIPQFNFQEHKHLLKGSHQLKCNLNVDQGDCHGDLALNHSHVEFTQLTPTTELPDDILVNSPVNMKKSASYPFNLTYDIKIEKDNSLDIAGLSGPLKGHLHIEDMHNQQAQATGQIKLEPATFTLFGKHIPIQVSQMDYQHSPLDSPMINIATSKSIRSSNNEMSDIYFSIFGRTPDLNINLKSSDNSMTQLEIISAFFSGPRDKTWTAETDKVALSILSSLLSESQFLNLLKSLSNLEKGLSIDSLLITPRFSISNDLSDTIMATQITLKKNLTQNSFLQYRFLLNENKNGMLSFIYQLPSNLLLELYLQINQNSHGINLLYQQ